VIRPDEGPVDVVGIRVSVGVRVRTSGTARALGAPAGEAEGAQVGAVEHVRGLVGGHTRGHTATQVGVARGAPAMLHECWRLLAVTGSGSSVRFRLYVFTPRYVVLYTASMHGGGSERDIEGCAPLLQLGQVLQLNGQRAAQIVARQ